MHQSKFRKVILVTFLFCLSVFVLSSCGSRGGANYSQGSLKGFVPEEHLPSDVSMVFSYSLMNDEQFSLTNDLQEKLGDKDKFSRSFLEGFYKDLTAFGLDFGQDLSPVLGSQFRMIIAGRTDAGLDSGGPTSHVFSVVTLAEPKQMEKLFADMAKDGKLKVKKISSHDTYFDENAAFYAVIFEDMLFISNTPEDLLEMLDLDPKDSIWASDLYQDDLKRVGDDYLFFLSIYPGSLGGGASLPVGVSFGGTVGALSDQVFVVRAAPDGFALDGFARLDKKKAKESDITFEDTPTANAYLHKEVPSDGLMFYAESFGLQQSLVEAEKLMDGESSLEKISTVIRNYTAMDLETEILTFMNKGYALAVHQNAGGVLPGVSLYFDVSGDPSNAQRFVDKIDGQLAGLVTVLEAGFPGAVRRESTEINGTKLSSIVLDLNSVPRSGSSPLPASVTSEPMKLTYGLVNERLLVTTANVWGGSFDSIAKDVQFEQLSKKITGVTDGIVYMDVRGILGYMDELQALREQLNLDTEQTASLDFAEILKGFAGGLAMSKTDPYEVRMSGFLMLAEQ